MAVSPDIAEKARVTPESKGLRAEHHIATLCGLGAVLLGVAGLVGWIFRINFLIRIAPGFKGIAPVIATFLIFLGLILLRLTTGHIGKSERLLWAAVAGFISLYSFLDPIGFVVGADPNFEDALTAYLTKVSSIPFETMSPIAGALMFLLGAAMLLLLLHGSTAPAQPIPKNRRALGDFAVLLALFGGVLALICGLGYAYGTPRLYGSTLIPISVTAVIGGFLLAVGVVVAAGRAQWPFRAIAGDSARARLLRAFVPLTIVAALAISVMEHRLAAGEDIGHVLVGSALAVGSALVVGLVVSRIARGIGDNMDQARLAQEKAERALRESQTDLNHAQAVAHIGSWRMDVRRNELHWSEESHRIFGIPQGTPLTYESFLATIHPEDREYVDKQWQAALRGAPYDIEHRIIIGDTVKWVREQAELELDEEENLIGGFGTVHDITARKQAEQERERLLEERRRQAALLETILENTDAHLVYLDRNFNFIWVNSTYARACRRSREEFVGRNHFELYPHAENEAIFKRVRDTGEPVRFVEKPFEHPDTPDRGTTYWDWTLTPLKNAQGEVGNLIFSLSDVTEKVKTRQQLLEVERLRTQMAETIALEINHRMKNNLMLVSGILDLQLSSHLRVTDVTTALRQAQARIAALSTVHEQMYERRSERVDLSSVLQRVAEMAVGALSAEEVELSFHGDPIIVSSRAATTLALVGNELVTNALKHGAIDPNGGRRVDIALSHQSKELSLRVWSAGNPIPLDFDPRKQSGLGLRLCRELVEGQLHGRFRLRPQEGGTVGEAIVAEEALEQ